MKKIIFLFLFLCLFQTLYSQNRINYGYVGGISNISVNSKKYYQPLYGIGLSLNFRKVVSLETNFIYYQGLKDKTTQSDYLRFSNYLKFGYFGNKVGIYGLTGFSINPCIHHSNIKNHSYTSILFSPGIEYNISKRLSVDFKSLYDIGIMKGYILNNKAYTYKGLFIMFGIRYNLKN